MEKIYQIKKRREDKACRWMQEKKGEVKEAKQTLAEKQKELVDYNNFRIEREKQLFQEVVSKSMRTKELDMYKYKVGKLREGEAKKKQRAEQARKKLDDAIEVEKKAIDEYNQAFRNRRKIEEFSKVIEEQRRKDQERKMEKELEDVSHRKINLLV
jgi:hypothetical protein